MHHEDSAVHRIETKRPPAPKLRAIERSCIKVPDVKAKVQEEVKQKNGAESGFWKPCEPLDSEEMKRRVNMSMGPLLREDVHPLDWGWYDLIEDYLVGGEMKDMTVPDAVEYEVRRSIEEAGWGEMELPEWRVQGRDDADEGKAFLVSFCVASCWDHVTSFDSGVSHMKIALWKCGGSHISHMLLHARHLTLMLKW